MASEAREACRRESLRLEANKAAAAGMLRLFDNPVLAAREHGRFVRDLNRSINLHNSLCKRYPVVPLLSEDVEASADEQGCHVQRSGR